MGLGIAGTQYRWPARTIPYQMDAGLGCAAAAADAIAHWNTRSCIRFAPRAAEPDFIRLRHMPGVALSAVGRRGGVQMVELGDSCSVGTVIHELGHSVGLWHELCRADRDDWITIDWTNIRDGCEDNFKQDSIASVAAQTIDFGDYDYGSIMHYGVGTFAIDPEVPVLTPRKPLLPGQTIGQRTALSPGDLATVLAMYADVAAPV